MRIVITSPPKMGNKWLKCLLGTAYGLDWLRGDNTPMTRVEDFREWVAEGNFRDDTIFHQHCRFKPALCDTLDQINAHTVSIIRNPYDAFVSMYYWLQTRKVADEEKGKQRRERPRDVLVGKPMTDPAILEYLATDFGVYIRRAVEWNGSGRSHVVRYEDLHKDTFGVMKRLTDQIQPVDDETLHRAIENCKADNMRKLSPKMAQHIRSATVGDSKERLSEAHHKIFREQYAEELAQLGYEVR